MKILPSILILMFSSSAFGGEISISTLITTIEKYGIKAANDIAVRNSNIVEGHTVVHISDQAYSIGNSEVVETTWFYVSKSDKSFTIYLPIAQRYLKGADLFSNHSFTECGGSGATAGAKYLSFKNEGHVFYTYSSGSMGASFSFAFVNEKYESLEKKCKAAWRS